jgi:hypothetical protein
MRPLRKWDRIGKDLTARDISRITDPYTFLHHDSLRRVLIFEKPRVE